MTYQFYYLSGWKKQQQQKNKSQNLITWHGNCLNVHATGKKKKKRKTTTNR